MTKVPQYPVFKPSKPDNKTFICFPLGSTKNEKQKLIQDVQGRVKRIRIDVK